MWHKKWHNGNKDSYNPVLISCRIPSLEAPQAISLSSKPCDPTGYLLKFQKFTPKKRRKKLHKKISVCVKLLNFTEDISEKLISWIELNKILGADDFYIYVYYKIDKRILEVLDWYSKNGNVRLIQLEFPGSFTSNLWQKRRYEALIYNDCLYRNLNAADFILPIDFDELIVPKLTKTWQQLLSTLPMENFASFSIRNAYYPVNNDYSSADIFFSNLFRTNYSNRFESSKSFVSTSNTLIAFNHYALQTLKPEVQRVFFVPIIFAQMNHYKNSCDVNLLPECNELFSNKTRIYDAVINKYKQSFLLNFDAILHAIRNKKTLG